MSDLPADIPSQEPNVLIIGDKWTWEKSISDYPASDYTLSYIFFNEQTPATRISITASADGSDHLIEDTNTSEYTAGEYRWQSFLTNDVDERMAYQSGKITIKADPATTTADQRSHNKKCLDAIEAVLLGRASQDVLSYTINGRQLQKTPIADLIKMRDYYTDKVAQEDSEMDADNGRDDGNLIRGKFYDPQ